MHINKYTNVKENKASQNSTFTTNTNVNIVYFSLIPI